MKKLTELAKEIDLDPEELYRELVKRGLEIIAVERELSTADSDAILAFHSENPGAKIDFDLLYKKSVKGEFSRDEKIPIDNFEPSYGKKFELKVGSLISHYFPNSHLSSVFLYIAKQLTLEEGRFGREMDHLMHIKKGSVNRLLIIECKAQEISISKDKKSWIVKYNDGSKDVKRQLKMQAKAVLQMMKPLPEMNLEIHNIAVSSSRNSIPTKDEYREQGIPVVLEVLNLFDFQNLLESYQKEDSEVSVLRIFQSELLRRLRQGKPCKHLGHPDIRDAIDYHKRIRRTMDLTLFKHFNPSRGKWAINGTAGMGKTVLLAYTACVLSCDHELVFNENAGLRKLQKFDCKPKAISYWKDRSIVVYAIQKKQLSVVQYFFDFFKELFQENDIEGRVSRFHKPRFFSWDQTKKIEGNVVLVDEAHDLCSASQKKVSEWCEEDSNYLVIACDRHQKLRLVEEGDQKRMISGLDFT